MTLRCFGKRPAATSRKISCCCGLSRPSGTFCFRERDALLKDTQAYNTWKFCGEQTHDRILAYAVELTGTANGTLQGNLYELDYQQHFQHIRDAALPVGSNRLIYESGMRGDWPERASRQSPGRIFRRVRAV